MKHPARLLAAVLAALAPAVAPLVASGTASAAEQRCDVPASLTITTRPLPHLAAALRPGRRLDVLALGSASLLGAHGALAGSVPDRMAAMLRASAPGAAIGLTLRADHGNSAAEMLATLRRELAAHPYQLVLWQTGTIEALRGQAVGPFRRTLADGIAAAAAAGADLVLIDMQYSRLLDRRAELTPYRAAMTEAALAPGVMLFPRYALTRAWAEDGQIDIEDTARPNRRRTAEQLRTCLAAALAHLLLEAAGARG